MPFDARGYEAHTLADHLATIGITPVPMAVLEAHKAAQVQKYPQSRLLDRKLYLLMGGIIALVPITADLLIRPPTTWLDVGVLVFFGLLTTCICAALAMVVTFFACECFGIKVLEKAQWLESTEWRFKAMPQPIRDIVRRTNDALSGTIVYGELIQNEALLDPYIVVRMRTEQACLGIWDGDQIIAIAEMH